MSDPNANVPVGTIADHEGLPRTVLRDYDTVIIPALQLTLDGLDLLEAVLADARQQVRDYQASIDEEYAELKYENDAAADLDPRG